MNLNKTINELDPELAKAVKQEQQRQEEHIELIASENYASQAIMDLQGSVLTNKYAEGYPGRRYYGGCEYVDKAEALAIERAKQLFQADYANVQPHSGSQGIMGVYLTFIKPGDTVLGLSLAHGGHLTHGSPVNFSGALYNFVSYGVSKETGRVDFEEVSRLAKEHKPKLIICGGSAYPRFIEFEQFRQVADEVGAFLMADIAHPSGLVASGIHPTPWPYCDVVTSTTHKTLRGPRGGMILCNDETISKKVNSAIFPGIQGGPLMHVIAAKAVAFGEALEPGFKIYQRQVRANAVALADELIKGGLDIVTGGTDTHVMLVDLRPKGVKGNQADKALGRANITTNKNGIPFDPEKPTVTSGLRLGTPAGTTRGFNEEDFRIIARWIVQVVEGLAANGEEHNGIIEARVKTEVETLCSKFPIYDYL